MLKRLELVGFKSFADKTRFDFGPGLTAIVGPNGSGKSNVADAIRWVLGEQSAKSLRGGEMTEVIFGGTASRKPLGLAEVSLTLNNASRCFAIEAEEIQLTRRVYQDGQGEYLLNQQPARLRDLRELLLGSGAGNDASCLIEQGRVDALLQASHLERRQVLEEAAGISRFRAKRTETERKLEQVDQNLARFGDVLEELKRQTASSRQQAGRARKHQEYSAKLRDLRLALAMKKGQSFTAQLDTLATELADAQVHAVSLRDEVAKHDLRMARFEDDTDEFRQQLRRREVQLSQTREQLAELSGRALLAMERANAARKEHVAVQQRLAAVEHNGHTLDAELTAAMAMLSATNDQEVVCATAALAAETALTAAEQRLAAARERREVLQRKWLADIQALQHGDAASDAANAQDLPKYLHELGGLLQNASRKCGQALRAATHGPEDLAPLRLELPTWEQRLAVQAQRSLAWCAEWVAKNRPQMAAFPAQVTGFTTDKPTAPVDDELEQYETECRRSREAVLATKVDLARATERTRSTMALVERLRSDRDRTQHEVAELKVSLHGLELSLQSPPQMDEAAATQGTLENVLRELDCERQQLLLALEARQLERQSLQAEARQLQQAAAQATSRVHQLELGHRELQHHLETLAARLREEEQVELAALLADAPPLESNWPADQLQAEISELRLKLQRLGHVNLNALSELATLEAREAELLGQHQDLVDARSALTEMLTKLNSECRRKFTETFAAVREHFQEIFRKLFGGGVADLVLEHPDEALESGIDIIARPPGKEPRSLSLLSGGEKSLTAVALLLAIFRHRPSPFCVMDEVDAALDEANVGRFAAVLREFLAQSQFILITHSKKTMAAADVLYGITMQEAGVSRRIAIHLEAAPTARAA